MRHRVPLTLAPQNDIHTSDLTDSCMQRVLLRHEHKSEPVAPKALFRGLLVGKALEFLHKGASPDALRRGMHKVFKRVMDELSTEGREPSESVLKNRDELNKQVSDAVQHYDEQLMPLFRRCELIGTEVACRLKIGETNYASHLDLVLRDHDNVLGYGAGRLIIADWKFRQDVPTKAYLARNMQFCVYWLAALQGSLLAYPELDGWVDYAEDAQMLWVHLPNLFPYKRKTTKHINGENVVFPKGSPRPVNTVLHKVNFRVDCADQVRGDLEDRVSTMRAGFFPKSPDPVGCAICDVRDFCTRGDTTELLENTQ